MPSGDVNRVPMAKMPISVGTLLPSCRRRPRWRKLSEAAVRHSNILGSRELKRPWADESQVQPA